MYALLSSEVPHLVRDLALVLGVAAITSVLFQKWRQPLVLGYLLAGAILGPNIPVPLHVYDETVLRDLSELGVTLVVFCIGLEFSLSRIGTMGAGALIATSVEMGLQLLLGVLIGHALGLDPRGGLFLGTLIAVSSTMLVQRVLNERTKDPRLRELVLGLLVVEDLGVILLLAILSAFSSGAEASWSEVGITTLKLGVFLVSTLAIGMWLLPQAWLAVLRLRRKETTIVFALGVCFFFALVASAAGFSSALGAFLAGSILAQAGAGHEIERRIEGVRDMFAAVFFVTVGMLVDPDVLLEHAGLVALLFGVVVVGKFFGVGLGTFLSGADRPVALRAGLAMGQIGEFGFVVAGMGVSSQFLPAHYSSVAVAVCALSAFTAPLFLSHADSIAAGVERVLPRRLETLGSLYSAWLAQLRASGARDVRYGAQRKLLRALALDLGALALLVGATGTLYARGTPAVARALDLGPAAAGAVLLLLVAVPALPLLARVLVHTRKLALAMALKALPPVQGRMDAAVTPRRSLAMAVQVALLLAAATPLVALAAPFLPVLASPAVVLVVVIPLAWLVWRAATQLDGHVRAGAEVIAEALVQSQGNQAAVALLPQLLPGIGELRVVPLDSGNPSCGATLRELELASGCGAQVYAVTRGTERITMPDEDFELRAGDLVALGGSPDAVAAAERRLHAATHA